VVNRAGVPLRVTASRTASGKLLLAFRDRRQAGMPSGQRVAEYYWDTIGDTTSGLALAAGSREWFVDGAAWAAVAAWARHLEEADAR
jgi:hypothetical protein